MQPLDSVGSADRRLALFCCLAVIALMAAMATPFFLGLVYTADDLGAFHLPLRAFYSQQLARGEPFDWLPSLFSGFYLTGEGQLGTYHPWHWLLYRTLPLTAAFDLELLLSYPLMLAGVYVLLRRLLHRPGAALYGGLVFTFGGFNLLHFIHPNAIAVVGQLPWAVWAIDVVMTDRDSRRRAYAAAGLSLITGSQILLGYPQFLWLSLLTESGYVLARWPVIAARPAPPLARLLAAQVAGLLIGGIQLLPTADALADSVRHTADASFTNAGSAHPLNLLQLVGPYLFKTRVVGQNTHELGMYCGAVPLLLCAWLLTHRPAWQPWRWVVRYASLLAVLALLLAGGEYGGVYQLQRHLPLVGQLRFPCRAIVLFQLSIGALSAVALAVLLSQRGQMVASPDAQIANASESSTPLKQPSPFPWCLVVVASLAAALGGPLCWPEFVSAVPLVWAGPAWFIAGAVALAGAERSVRGATAALVLLTAADLGLYGCTYGVWPGAQPLPQFVADQSLPPDISRPVWADPPAALAAGQHVGNELILAGVRRADGYAGLAPRKRLDYSRVESLRLAGVGWTATDASPRTASATDPLWLPVADPLPRIRLAPRDLLAADSELPPAVLESGAALVEKPLDLGGGEPGEISALRESPGRFELTTQTDTDQLLVIAESYHAGWRAEVDGQVAPVVRVNRDFLGVPIPPGSHRVQLAFRPASLARGAMVSSLGLGLMVALLALSLGMGRRAQSPNLH